MKRKPPFLDLSGAYTDEDASRGPVSWLVLIAIFAAIAGLVVLFFWATSN